MPGVRVLLYKTFSHYPWSMTIQPNWVNLLNKNLLECVLNIHTPEYCPAQQNQFSTEAISQMLNKRPSDSSQLPPSPQEGIATAEARAEAHVRAGWEEGVGSRAPATVLGPAHHWRVRLASRAPQWAPRSQQARLPSGVSKHHENSNLSTNFDSETLKSI